MKENNLNQKIEIVEDIDSKEMIISTFKNLFVEEQEYFIKKNEFFLKTSFNLIHIIDSRQKDGSYYENYIISLRKDFLKNNEYTNLKEELITLLDEYNFSFSNLLQHLKDLKPTIINNKFACFYILSN